MLTTIVGSITYILNNKPLVVKYGLILLEGNLNNDLNNSILPKIKDPKLKSEFLNCVKIAINNIKEEKYSSKYLDQIMETFSKIESKNGFTETDVKKFIELVERGK